MTRPGRHRDLPGEGIQAPGAREPGFESMGFDGFGGRGRGGGKSYYFDSKATTPSQSSDGGSFSKRSISWR